MAHANIINSTRLETLTRDNYDTWKIQVEALLTKNDLWGYVCGEKQKPGPSPEDASTAVKEANQAAITLWTTQDRKARSDLILSISPSELKQIRDCQTSKDVWDRLDNVFASKGPARKATLLKQLSQQKMNDGDDVREHLNSFFDAVDKLQSMQVEINGDLLSIMLLYSLPDSFENFRIAIETRDTLPTADSLRVKIIEENESRKQKMKANQNGAFLTKHQQHGQRSKKSNSSLNDNKHASSDNRTKMRCKYCKMKGHVIDECRKKKRADSQKGHISSTDELYFADARSSDQSPESPDTLERWCLDSGATSHLCNKRSLFVNSQEVKSGLRLASSASTAITARGNVRISTQVGQHDKSIILQDTYLVPDLRTNLLSVTKLVDKGNTVTFTQKGAVIKNNQDNIRLVAHREGNLFYLNQDPQRANAIDTSSSAAIKWHQRLGHLNYVDIKELVNAGYIQDPNIDVDHPPPCETCISGKLTRLPFPKRTSKATQPLEIVHTDLCGKMRTTSQRGAQYFITFTDEFSRWTDVYFLRNKDQVPDVFLEYKAKIENQTGYKIKALQSDNGKEYCNARMDTILKKSGIRRRLTCTHTPQQNGTAERKNRTLVEMARCMLMQSGMSPSFWAEAIAAANHVRNRCPTRSLDNKDIPYEKLTGRRTNLQYLKPFGCKVFALNKQPGKGKFDARAIEGKLVGYSEDSKAFRVWIPSEHQVRITRDVKFIEELDQITSRSSDIIDENTLSGRNRLLDLDNPGNVADIGHDASKIDNTSRAERLPSPVQQRVKNYDQKCVDSNTDSKVTADNNMVSLKRGPGRPTKIKTGKPGRPKKSYHYTEKTSSTREDEEHSDTEQQRKDDQNSSEYQVPDDEVLRSSHRSDPPKYSGKDEPSCLSMCSEEDVDWPHAEFAMSCSEISLSDAISGPEREEWMKAIYDETRSLLENNAWEMVDRPPNRKVIGSRTVLRNKYKSDGSLERRKARIVAKGYNQTPESTSMTPILLSQD